MIVRQIERGEVGQRPVGKDAGHLVVDKTHAQVQQFQLGEALRQEQEGRVIESSLVGFFVDHLQVAYIARQLLSRSLLSDWGFSLPINRMKLPLSMPVMPIFSS